MGSRIFGVITMIVGAGILADILIHPAGTAAAGNAAANLWKPLSNTILGYKN